MKVCVLQPAFSMNPEEGDARFEAVLNALDKVDSSSDIVVLPESADVPFATPDRDSFMAAVNKNSDRLLEKCKKVAVQCGATVFVNATRKVENGGYRNRTTVIDKTGAEVGHYDKQHLVPMEVSVRKLDSGYTYEANEPYILELDGVRYAFLTCYDFYFYEMFARIARLNPDVIIGCSQQRTDTHRALEVNGAFLAYNTNAYVIRASVSMGENATVGGASMVIAPDSTVLLNLESKVTLGYVEIDPHKRYLKPQGFGNPMGTHHDYIEKGRRPWKYRPAGSAICLNDDLMGYPRVCAHRGFSVIAPENSMPAYGAAVAMGADEIELDLWPTLDGELVSLHDNTLDRISTGTGDVRNCTYEQLLSYDFGVKAGKNFEGLKILKFEEVLEKLACHTIMNIHVKTQDEMNHERNLPYNEKILEKMVAMIRKYDAAKHVYFMTVNETLQHQMAEMAPDIHRCMGVGADPWQIVEAAIRCKTHKAQFFNSYTSQEMIDKAHANGIIVNMFYSDKPEQAKQMLDMGVDTILSNNFLAVKLARDEWVKAHK